MATYEYKSWQTISLPIVTGDTYFIILDHQVSSGSTPIDETEGVVFSGKIVDGYNLRNIDEILDQYVYPQDIEFSSSLQLDDYMHKTFYVYYSQDGWDTYTYDSIVLTYDWSYGIGESNIKLSSPIVNLLDCRQYFLYTSKAPSPDVTSSFKIKLEGTEIGSYSMSGFTYYNYVQRLDELTYPGEFNYEYSYDFFVDIEGHPVPGTMNKLTIGTNAIYDTYWIALTCNRYCIYYINKFGGWDSMLFKGRELMSDSISRLSYKKNYTAMSQEFGQVDYLTKIVSSWSLNTSFRTDEQSSKMAHLLETNRAYLHDLVDDKIYPICITNASCELKTYKNQGRKMAVYTVEAKASQEKYRIN